jgi:hypothetical protein
MYVVCLLSATESFACAGDDNAAEPPPEPAEVVLEPYECGPFEGSYRVLYAKRSGDCADLPEQLAHFDDRGRSSALSDDCEASVAVSEDGCSREEDSVCPVLSNDGAAIGSATLLTAFTQTSAVRIEGMAKIELTTDAGKGCSAIYSLIGSKVVD